MIDVDVRATLRFRHAVLPRAQRFHVALAVPAVQEFMLPGNHISLVFGFMSGFGLFVAMYTTHASIFTFDSFTTARSMDYTNALTVHLQLRGLLIVLMMIFCWALELYPPVRSGLPKYSRSDHSSTALVKKTHHLVHAHVN